MSPELEEALAADLNNSTDNFVTAYLCGIGTRRLSRLAFKVLTRSIRDPRNLPRIAQNERQERNHRQWSEYFEIRGIRKRQEKANG